MSDALRSKELAEKYISYRASGALDKECVLCKAKTIKSFKHWRVIDNKFPYDRIAKKHHMLIPVRHVQSDVLNAAEIKELREIKAHYAQAYDYMLETTHRTKSIPEHFHLHLLLSI